MDMQKKPPIQHPEALVKGSRDRPMKNNEESERFKSWELAPALPSTDCLIFNKSLSLPKPQSPICKRKALYPFKVLLTPALSTSTISILSLAFSGVSIAFYLEFYLLGSLSEKGSQRSWGILRKQLGSVYFSKWFIKAHSYVCKWCI